MDELRIIPAKHFTGGSHAHFHEARSPRLTFRMLLSCQCPLTGEQERALFDRLVALNPGDTIDCSELLSIFKPNENTPIQRLVHFSMWMAPAGSKEMVIERDMSCGISPQVITGTMSSLPICLRPTRKWCRSRPGS